jgi:hypothetical protein
MALVEAALRFGAHAALQLSCSSLAHGNACRSLAFEGITLRAGFMHGLHKCRV